MLRSTLAVAAKLMLTTPCLAQEGQPVPPLPEPLDLAAPAAELPDALRGFAGAWAGIWGEGQRHVLVVERLRADGTAQVVSAVAPPPGIAAPGQWVRAEARLEGDALVLRPPGPLSSVVAYRRDGADRLAASYALANGAVTPGVLARADPTQLPAQLRSGALAWPRWGESVRIPHPAGRITLEGTFYRHPSGAPAPLAAIVHGLDGPPRRALYEPALALWLQAQGYAVLLPMRRGRGGSEGNSGPADLASGTPQAGLDAAQADLAAAIAFAQKQPGVRPGRTLLVGTGRGGLVAIAQAGQKPQDIAGVISFAGAWTGSDDAAALAAAGQGAGGRVPQLWIHAERDSVADGATAMANHETFAYAGGKAQIGILRDVPGDGRFVHLFIERWRPLAEAFLATAVRR